MNASFLINDSNKKFDILYPTINVSTENGRKELRDILSNKQHQDVLVVVKLKSSDRGTINLNTILKEEKLLRMVVVVYYDSKYYNANHCFK